MSDSPKAVTVIARHRVLPDRQDDFEAWIAGITETCSAFSGYLGTEVVRPTRPDERNVHTSIFRFDSYENLKTWMESPERKSWLDRVDTFSDETPEVSTFDSLQHWFPREAGQKPPSNLKMSIVTFVVIWPLVHWIPGWVSWALPEPPWLVEGVATAIIVLLMTYAVMPIAIRATARWLYD